MNFFTQDDINNLIQHTLLEDIGSGDITSQSIIPAQHYTEIYIHTRDDIIIAGLDIALRCFEFLIPNVNINKFCTDGDKLSKGSLIATIEGNTRLLLAAERSFLNILQNLSGISTITDKYVQQISDHSVKIRDTRKTLPGWRNFTKYATYIGGALNHRKGLYDAIMIKDNHISIMGSIKKCVDSVRYVMPETTQIEVECDTLSQVKEAVDLKVDMILLDNMSLNHLRESVFIINKCCKIEASGNINLDTVSAISQTGVDYISVGAITHSAPCVDIGCDMKKN